MPRIGAPPTTLAHAEAHQHDGLQEDHTKHPKHTAQGHAHHHATAHTHTHTSHEQPSLDIVENEAFNLVKQHEPDHKEMRPTQVAEWHGNKPSKGAVVDEELAAADLEELKRKGRV